MTLNAYIYHLIQQANSLGLWTNDIPLKVQIFFFLLAQRIMAICQRVPKLTQLEAKSKGEGGNG